MEQPNDAFLLKTIANYCNNIADTIDEFKLNETKIAEHAGFRAMLAFFVQQIGETANKLSPEFKAAHPEIEWKAIVGFRHHIVHAYGGVMPSILWSTAVKNVPALRDFCTKIMSEQ